MKAGFFGQAQGLTNSYWSPLAIPELTEQVVVRAFEWFDRVSAAEGSIRDNGYLIFEVMQKVKPIQYQVRITPDLTGAIRQHSTLNRCPQIRLHGPIR